MKMAEVEQTNTLVVLNWESGGQTEADAHA